MTSLKPMEIKTSNEEKTGGNGIKFFRRYYYFGIALLPFLFLLVSFDSNIGSGAKKSNRVCHQECSVRRDQRYDYFKGRDILNTPDLLRQVTDETKELIMKLKVDYGEETFDEIFITEEGKVRPFVPYSDKSAERLRRKLMIKVLSAQRDLMKKESAFNGCDCINGDVGIPGSVKTKIPNAEDDENSFPPLDTTFENYIWATGGHSASAGHGNLYNESYTAFMERDLKDVFGSIGIDFQGRNYAMGGTGSAAEIAMCWNEIFGDDVDFFSWDYGMTDAGKPLRLVHYAYRGARSPGRPAFMGIRVSLERGEQGKAVEYLENNGIPIFLQDNDLWAEMRKGIPDTFGLSTDEMSAMPEYVRNYKCNGVIEKGEPFCEAEKYSRDICPNRQGGAPWHPGIKTHAMVGHSLALFLIDNLLGALEELVKLEYENVETLLSRLLREEDDLYNGQIMKMDFQRDVTDLYSLDKNDEEALDSSVFFTGESMCHTARIPSQTRYLGYLTNTDKVGGPVPFGKETYDIGVEEKQALQNSDTMQLVWTEGKMHNQDCPFTVNVDHKDSFLSIGDGWKSLVFPNEAERRAFNYDPEKLQGIVVIMFTSCNWGECEDGYLGPKDLGGDANEWQMKINGTPVKRFLDIGHDAFVAKGKDGLNFPPSPDGDYKFEIELKDPSKHVKISSFVVY